MEANSGLGKSVPLPATVDPLAAADKGRIPRTDWPPPILRSGMPTSLVISPSPGRTQRDSPANRRSPAVALQDFPKDERTRLEATEYRGAFGEPAWHQMAHRPCRLRGRLSDTTVQNDFGAARRVFVPCPGPDVARNTNIWVAGIGGIGGVIGYRLVRAGLTPLLIDAWTKHVTAMKETGLVLKDQFADQPMKVRAIELGELDSRHAAPDLVFLCVKSFQTADFLQSMAARLGKDSTVVSLQNGINEEYLASEIGADRVIGAVVMMDGGLVGPGVARQENPEERNFVLGTLDGKRTGRLAAATELLDVVGSARTSSNIWGELWSKLIHNCLINAVCALSDRNAAWALREDTVWRTAQTLAREAVQVALANDISLEPSGLFGCEAEAFFDTGLNSRLRQAILVAYPETEDLFPSMHQDVRKGRKTEIGFLNGWIARKGKEAGVPTPLSEAVTGLVHCVEQGSLQPGPGIVDRLFPLLAAANEETEQSK